MEERVSLLKKKISETQTNKLDTFKIYIEDYQGNSRFTRVYIGQSVEEAIGQALFNFNRDLKAGLPQDPNLYDLYPAKAGRRDTGYPALEKGQPLNLVGKQRFCLVSRIGAGKYHSVTSLSSIRPIEMQFTSKGKEQSVKESRVFFCLCGGW